MDSGDDRDSMAAGGRSDGGNDLPSDVEGMNEEPNSPEEPAFHGRGGGGQLLGGQEGFLADHMHKLNSLMHLEKGVDLPALHRCLMMSLNIYRYMIDNRLSETADDVFLMYESFFQPFMREALPPAMQQLMHDERQAQLLSPQNHREVREARAIVLMFIQLVVKYLRLALAINNAREFMPVVHQRPGEDLAHLLRTLAIVLEPGHMLYCPAFHAEAPSACPGWRDVPMGIWAAPAVPAAPAALAGEGTAAAAAGPESTVQVDLTGEAAAAPPETPSRQVAAATWRAAMVEVMGVDQGWDMLLELLKHPERLGDYLWAFLAPVATAAPAMLPEARHKLGAPMAAILQYIRAGLAAVADLSALEGNAPNPEARLARVLTYTRACLAAMSGHVAAEQEVGPLQREHVLRLLSATAFTRQLAGLKLLNDLVNATFRFSPQQPECIEALTSWLRANEVVHMVLKSNMHQAQYAEQAQRVLSTLLQHGALPEDAVAFLWQLTEDASTFEAVKSNAYSILANLGPHMEPAQLDQLFQRLQARAAASGVSEACSILGLLVGMAQRDRKNVLHQGALQCLLAIQLRTDVQPEVAASLAVVELCATLDSAQGNSACGILVAQRCIAALDGEAAVPAAVVLHSLLTQLWRKQDRLTAVLKQLNADAALLKACLAHYTAWLKRQRTAAAALGLVLPAEPGSILAARDHMAVAGPPSGAFSHKEAVDAWQRLIHKVITAGNWFLLQDQVERMAQWATTDAVTPYDSSQAWRLAMLLVAGGRKEMVPSVADGFLVDCLCKLEPRFVTFPAWRCILAYLAATCVWKEELREDTISPHIAWVTKANHAMVRAFLWRLALDTPDANLSAAASSLLATVHTRQLRTIFAHSTSPRTQQPSPDAWLVLLAGDTAERLAQLRQEALLLPLPAATPATKPPAAAAAEQGPGEVAAASKLSEAEANGTTDASVAAAEPAAARQAAAVVAETPWWEPPVVLAKPGASSAELEAAAMHCERVLKYLATLVEECQGRRMPSPPAHRSSWRGFPMNVTVQLPIAGQGQKPVKQEIQQPSNLPVGCLRRTVAEWLGKQPQFVRLVAGGRELESDCATLVHERAGQQPVMVLVNQKSNSYSGQHVAKELEAAAASQALVQQPEVYSLALALAQCDAAATSGTALSGGSRLAAAALQLLSVLPTCPAARQQLRQLLQAPDGGQQLRALLQRQSGQATVKPAVLMYAAQCLAGLLYPQQADAEAAADVAQLGGPEEVGEATGVLAAGYAAGAAELLQRRLLLSGALEVVLDLATQQADPAAAADAGIDAAMHTAVLLLLMHTHVSLQQQQAAAAAAVAAEAAAAAAQQVEAAAGGGVGEISAAAAVAAATAGVAALGDATSMQVDSTSAEPEQAGTDVDGGSSAVAAAEAGPGAGPEALPAPAEAVAVERSLSVSMEAEEGASAGASAAAGAALAASVVPAQVAAVRQELEAAATALASLAPAVARYVLHMLRCLLRCHPQQQAVDAQQAQHTGAPFSVRTTAQGQQANLAAVAELAEQGLQLLRQLAQHSSAAVQVATGPEAPTAEAVVRRLLLHPTSSRLRQLAADWLPSYAAASPATHRWAFERIVQPLLLAEGAEGPAAGGQEQLALCNHFIETLDYAEFPTARQLLQTLLRRLLTAIDTQAPIDGVAGVVGALIKRLDCREVGVSSNLVVRLLDGCCFPALSVLRQREHLMAYWVALADQAGKSMGAAAAVVSEGGADSPAAMQAAATAAQHHQAAAIAGTYAVAMWGQCEKCILAARLQAANGTWCSSREAAFDLLLDLVTHDSGCWQKAAEVLQTQVHEAARSLLAQPYNNSPLQLVRAPSAFAGLQNGGATCYMSSVFQQLFMQPTIRQLILSAPQVAPQEQADSVFHQMQAMFAHLACGVQPWFEPRGFWRAFRDLDGQPVNIREHQDAHEFFTRLQDGIDEHLRAVGRPRAIYTALGGTFAQLITVIEAPQHRSEREEEFYQISLDVRGKRTLAESLDSYVSKELMDGQNQYHSEQLGKKVDAEKRVLFKTLPHTLVLHLKRFEFDYETFQRWKVKDRFEFPLLLDMYPYTVEGADEADGRVPASKQPPGHYQYELRGVVVHSGTAFAGHYYSYIKDRSPSGAWFCFDDTSVEPWDPAKLDKDCFGGRFIPEGFTQECDRPNSAYMLFYERAEESAEQLLAAATAASAAADAAAASGAQQPAAEAAANVAVSAADAAAGAAGEAATAGASEAAVKLAAAVGGADEDTPMQTAPASDAPAAAEGPAGGQGGAATGPSAAAEEAQPMAVSPAPIQTMEQPADGSAGAAGATAGEAGGVQPPAVAQQAQPAGGSGLPYGMPLELYNSVLVSNLRQLGTMQLLSHEYNRFMWNLALLLGEAITAGTARKAAKREPTSSPGGMDVSAASGSLSNASAAGECQLAALTSRRGGDLHAVIAEVALVILDYSMRVALRGNLELRKEVLGAIGKRGRPGLRDHLIDAFNKVPPAACAALLYFSSTPGSQAVDLLLTSHPSEPVRELVATLGAIATDTATRQERRNDETVHAMRCYVDYLCASLVPRLLQAGGHFEQLFSVLARLGMVKYSWRRAMLDPHLPTLLALIRRAIDLFIACDADQRDYMHGTRVLQLLGSLLRRFSPEALQGTPRRKTSRQPLGEAELAQRNPYILESCEPLPMPQEVADWLYGDPAFLRKLLLPGCVCGMPILKLFGLLMFNNHRHAREWHLALLDHLLLDATDWRAELAPELHTLAGLLDVKDSLQTDRIHAVLLGLEDGSPGILQEMRSNRRSVGCQHLLLGLATHVLVEASQELVMEVADRWNNWPAWARHFLQRRYKSLHEEDLPDSGDLADAAEGAMDDIVDLSLDKLYQQVQQIEAAAANIAVDAIPSSPSATRSGSSSGGSTTTTSGSDAGGGGGQQLHGVTVGGRRLHQQTLGTGGGGGGQDWQAGLLQYSDGDSPNGGVQQPTDAAPAVQHEPPPQQHIAAHVAGDQEDEVIEIHSDPDAEAAGGSGAGS